MMPDIHLAGEYQAILGESIYWSANAKALLWVDVKSQKIVRYCPEARAEKLWHVPEQIGCIVDDSTGPRFLAALQSGFATITLPEHSAEAIVRPICNPEADRPGNRFNDGGIDPDGHFWAGSMDDAEKIDSGSWWRLAPDGRAQLLLSGFKVTNGPAFSLDSNFVFLTDSSKRIVFRGIYDQSAGLRDIAAWAEFTSDQGYPDGMTFGPDGNLWIAFWDGACVRALNSSGEIIRQIDMPVQRPTKIAFTEDGTAYVTSARVNSTVTGRDGRLHLFRLD
ncbi:SMP-30/gluconolactonase/LRE family protein [Parasphingorhabdus sp.]|uniref:SMP-30/gluconolactonase/LRE family protein n=1 Tax=Parasphingorhabdus sp. TaxID=2709688 RepID=UPI00300103F1